MGTPHFQFLAGLGSGLGGGVLSGLFGLGGGVVLVPLLGLALHLEQHQAQGITLAAMLLPNGLPAVLHYRRRGVRLQWILVGCLMIGFLAGAWGGAKIANLIPAPELRWGFITFLLLLALRTFLLHGKIQGSSPDRALSLREVWIPGILIGILGGVASGLLGIGGGVLMIPLMTAWLKLGQHEAQLSSLAMMLPPIGLPAVLVYAHAQGGLPWAILAGVATGFLLGAYLGARMATRIRGTNLRLLFGGILVLMAALLALRN